MRLHSINLSVGTVIVMVVMLSIGKLVAGQHSYYEQQVALGRDDYYSGRGEAPGEWVGRGSAGLGLGGLVAGEQFNALMEGRNPADLEQSLRKEGGRGCKVVGLDLTFSAPKSVSVLFAVADPGVAGELVAAHESAVAAALEWVEDEAVFVRQGRAMEFSKPTGLVAAAYRHRMSRAMDPQLHTHVVCANVAERQDGSWVSLHHPSLYRAAKTAGCLYQSHLRFEVQERLGLSWGEVRNGMAELTDIPADVLGVFSQRRQEMLEAARDNPELGGMETKAASSRLAIATRAKKSYGVETHTWRDEIQARASEHGLDNDRVGQIIERGSVSRGNGVSGLDERGIATVLVSNVGLTEKQNTFEKQHVVREFAANAGQGARVSEVVKVGARFVERSDVLRTRDDRLTTQELVECEQRLVDAAVGRVGEGVGLLDVSALDRALLAGECPLTVEQEAAVRGITQSGNGVDVLEALAGTGKTFTAGVLRHAYEKAGFTVTGVAPTARAVRELEDAGIPSWTLDRCVMDLDRYGGYGPNTVIIFDEAGMAGTRSSAQLLGAAEISGAKVIAIGDSDQLSSVQAGGWLRTVGDNVGAYRLTEVVRQRDRSERRALGALHDGKPELMLNWAESNGRLVFHHKDGIQAAIDDWKQASEAHGPADAVLIARDNRTRETLNTLARTHQQNLGVLGEDFDYGAITLAAGDRVIARRNDRDLDVDNGMRGTVRATFPDRVVIETDAGLKRELPAAYVSDHVQYAYCLTGHGMQGATVESATVVANPRDLSKNWSYTALSRARDVTRLHVITDTGVGDTRSDFAPKDATSAPDKNELKQLLARRMATRDDEDLAVTQLDPAEDPGRSDDLELITGAALSSQPQEYGAERTEIHTTNRQRPLSAVRQELKMLRNQRDSLPASKKLQRIDLLDQQRAKITKHRDELQRRLQALPNTKQGFRRGSDHNESERRRLNTALNATNKDLTKLDRGHKELLRDVGSIDEVRSEHTSLNSRITQLEKELNHKRDEHIRDTLKQRPPWTKELAGERPTDSREAQKWDQAITTAARYRIDHDILDNARGLGVEPEDRAQRVIWQETQTRIDRTLGRAHDRDRGLGR